MGAFLTYALDTNNDLVHVDDVAKGAKCLCHCPHCNALLYAKNSGTQREHHFAHAFGSECEGAFESSLHLLAKEIIQETGGIMLPKSSGGNFPTGYMRVHNVEIEKWDERYGIRPDAECFMENGERLIIEFYVSHKVDKKKRQVIVDNHIKCVEIDINYQSLDKAELREFLTESCDGRKWIVSIPPPHKSNGTSYGYGRNPVYGMTRDILKEIFDKETITIHPWGSYDLRSLGYDVCEVNTKFQGFKSDLLLYRSQKEDKGYISINIRGRRRETDFPHPKRLRIIDLVFKSIGSEEATRQRLEHGDLKGDLGLDVLYYGFKF